MPFCQQYNLVRKLCRITGSSIWRKAAAKAAVIWKKAAAKAAVILKEAAKACACAPHAASVGLDAPQVGVGVE